MADKKKTPVPAVGDKSSKTGPGGMSPALAGGGGGGDRAATKSKGKVIIFS